MTAEKIIFLREQFSWMGRHSGYDMICDAVKQAFPECACTSVWGERPPRTAAALLRRFMVNGRESSFYDVYGAAAEVKTLWRSFLSRPDIVHVLYVENDLGVLPAWKKRLGFRLVGTAHQPDSWWRLMHRNPGVVSCLDALITVSSREAAYFEQYLPGRVHFIPHGIDTDFFRPGADLAGREPIRCVFSGKWLRDIGTLARVMDSVLKQKPEIRFEMIVPRDKRDDPGFYHLARYNQITWHADLSDEQLLKIYQQSSMLVLPMIDCTANNALLEAMACALPVVSTRIGGMPDYTDDAFAELLPGGDAEGMTRAVIRLSEDPQRRRSMGIAARAYAERHFRWDDVARKTGDMYREILTSETNHESGVHHP